MPKEAISVTIEADNLVWLRGQVHASGRRSVSDVLDRLVTEARTSGRVEHLTIRSVVPMPRVPTPTQFDALVCAAARALGLPLVSRDADIRESGLVKIVW